MLILPLAMGNMSIACKITLYVILTQATRVTDMQGAISTSKREGCFIYPTKEDNQTYFTCLFIFYVSQHFCTPNIILPL
jgi:hypothetical protein